MTEQLEGIGELLKKKRKEILAIASRYGARNVRVFGSAAKGRAGPESDADLLVEMEPGRTLLDHVARIESYSSSGKDAFLRSQMAYAGLGTARAARGA